MADYTIAGTTGFRPTRGSLVTCINTGTSSTPVWSVMGSHVPDSSIEYDNSVEMQTDILDNSYVNARTAQMTQTLSGEQIAAGDAVMNHLLDLAIVQRNAAAMSKQDLLLIHDYLQTSGGASFAERYPESGVFITSHGGEGGSPIVTEISINFGGERVTGTASKSGGAITFTPGQHSENPNISIMPENVSLGVGETKELGVRMFPASSEITWTSSDSTKATVDDGAVTGVAAGTATITASITVSGQTYTGQAAIIVTGS